MSVLPPVLLGAVQDRVTSLVPPMPASAVGAAGAVNGVPDAVALTSPLPAAFCAATRTTYPLPLVRPVICADGEVTEAAVANEAPPSDEISTM